MILNNLYAFIELTQPHGFQLKQDLSQHWYALLDLPVTRSCLLYDQEKIFKLQKHHLSVYQHQDDRNAYLSQYHYTGYFTDNDQKHYELHVYFNSKDQLATSAVFSTANDDGKYVAESISDDLASSLEQFALDHVSVPVGRLRQNQKDYIENQEKEYLSIEAKLTDLSIDLGKNRENYLENLNVANVVLSRLVKIRQDNRYMQIANFFSSLRKALSQMQAGSTEDEASNQPEESDKEMPTSLGKMETSSTKITRKLVKKKKTVSYDYQIKELLTLKSDFEKKVETKSPFQDQVTAFQGFDTELRKVIGCVEIFSDNLNPDFLRIFSNLIAARDAFAKKLLLSLVVLGHFDLALKMKFYSFLLPDDLIKVALNGRNHKMLDFILTHCDIPVNTIQVTNNLTPVLFCYLQNTPEKPMVECLSVLVKHRASLFVKAPDGLPIAHHILDNPNHPLRKAFQDNVNVTVGRVWFRKHLINELKVVLEDSALDPKVAARLSSVIQSYNNSNQLLQQGPSEVLQNSYLKREMEHVSGIAAHYTNEEIDELKNDPEISSLTREVETLTVVFKEKAKQYRRKDIPLNDTSLLGKLNELIDVTGKLELEKKERIDGLNKIIEIFNLKIELLDIQEKIKTSRFGTNSHKRALNRQSAIIAKLKVLQEPYKILDKVEEVAKVKNFITNMDNLSNLIMQFSSVLGGVQVEDLDDMDDKKAEEFGRKLGGEIVKKFFQKK